MLSGNHDHGLAAGWIDARLQSEPAGFLGLEQRFDAVDRWRPGSPSWRRPVRLPGHLAPRRRLRHPRPLRGHPRDGADVRTARRRHDGAVRRPASLDGVTPDDYEAVLSPLYAWLHALTQRADHTIVSKGGGASSRSYTALTRRSVRALPIQAGYRAAVAALNLTGFGPLQSSLSPTALRRGYLTGFRAMIERLAIPAAYVIVGHSHRSGPWPNDDLAEWTAANGARIVNTGSWTYQPHFLTPNPIESPYFPGTAVIVDDDGPPELVRLLTPSQV